MEIHSFNISKEKNDTDEYISMSFVFGNKAFTYQIIVDDKGKVDANNLVYSLAVISKHIKEH